MSVIDRLTSELTKLPGIGPKTALRLAYHLMKAPVEDARNLAGAIEDVAEQIGPCRICGSYTERETCEICDSGRRDRSVICVVEEAYEVGAIERTNEYRGLFHVLGGRLSPLDGVGPGDLNVDGLLERIEDADPPVEEVIVATNSSMEGEATAVYLEELLRSRGVRVTRPARGIPVGSDLEYVDGSTIAEALAARREM